MIFLLSFIVLGIGLIIGFAVGLILGVVAQNLTFIRYFMKEFNMTKEEADKKVKNISIEYNKKTIKM